MSWVRPALEVPLAADPADDLRYLSFVVIAMDDSTARVTESLNEQGSSNVMARAGALGASVNVLPGSSYAGDPSVTYLCSVRTAGTPSEPVAFLVRDTSTSGCQADTDLPAPWQNVTLGGGFGSASYDGTSESFTLSSTSQNVPSEHFVYQTLSQDATLIARVQTLTTMSPDGKAGLMLRQSNDANAAYVFVAATPAGVVVESREGVSSSPAYVSGSSRTAPVWLKLERKEEGVYVYESDDGVSWTLITAIALSFASPVNVGMAISTPNDYAQAEISDVSVQKETSDRLVQIPGVPTSLALEALPYNEYEPLKHLSEDYLLVNGIYYPVKILYVDFVADMTIAQANALLREMDAEIVGSFPGRADIPLGLSLALRVPTTSYEALKTVVDNLKTSPLVENAVELILQDNLNTIPQPSNEVVWEVTASGGNWGLELSKVPQMWNLNAAVFEDGSIQTTVVAEPDFAPHEDINVEDVREAPKSSPEDKFHGTATLGIVGATFDNGEGIDGVTPFTNLVFYSSLTAPFFPRSLIENNPQVRIINSSTGSELPFVTERISSSYATSFFKSLQRIWGANLSSRPLAKSR